MLEMMFMNDLEIRGLRGIIKEEVEEMINEKN